jgi:hypothetical protein
MSARTGGTARNGSSRRRSRTRFSGELGVERETYRKATISLTRGLS